MIPINRPGACHESTFSFYARGLSRDKAKRAHRAGRVLVHPSSAPLEAGSALGSDPRGHDTPLAPTRQKRRWRARVTLGYLLVCAFGGADADQDLRFAPDGSVRGRERGGACLHWTSLRCPGADSRSLQHRAGLCSIGQGGNRRGQPPGDQGGASLWFYRRGGAVGRHYGAGTPYWVSQRTRHFAGAGPALWASLDAVGQAGAVWTRQGPRAGANDLAFGQRTPSLYHGQGGQTRGAHSDSERGGRVDRGNASAGRTSRDECGPRDTECARTADGDARGDQAPDGTDRTVDIDGEGGGGQNRPCGHSTSAGHGAQQVGQEDGVWLSLSDQPCGRQLSLWGAHCSQCGRKADAAQSALGVSSDLWSGGDARVNSVRPRWRFDRHPPATRVGRDQGCGHSAQREATVVGCRGSPGADLQRARSHRRKHWDVEKQSGQVQQAPRTSVADTGDGGAEVYPLVQSEQIHAGFGGANPVRDQQKQTERSQQRGRRHRQQEGMEAQIPLMEFCDTLYVSVS